MKIEHVEIDNSDGTGERWWAAVASKPDDPLIEATLKVVLSSREYSDLLARDRAARGCDPAAR